MPHSEAAKAVLRDADLGPAAGEQLVQRLGYSDPEDLALITPTMASTLHLRPLDALKLSRLLAAAQGSPQASGPTRGAGAQPARPAAVLAALSAAQAAVSSGGGTSVVTLASGRLQELARSIGACSNAACTIDLSGLAFSGVLTHGPTLFLDRSNLTLVGGTIHLTGDQQLLVTGLHVTMIGVTVRGEGVHPAERVPPAAAGPEVQQAPPGPGAKASRGMLQVQGGGTLLLRSCCLTGCARGSQVALLVHEGGAVEVDRSDIENNARWVRGGRVGLCPSWLPVHERSFAAVLLVSEGGAMEVDPSDITTAISWIQDDEEVDALVAPV